MESQFWSIIDSLTDARWWFGLPALLVASGALLLAFIAMLRLHEREPFGAMVMVLLIGSALALLLPAALIAINPFAALGINRAQLTLLPTETFSIVAQTLDETMQLSYLGAAALVLAALSVFGAFGSTQPERCPNCGRPQHPGWRGICPECRLLEPSFLEVPQRSLHEGLSSVAMPQTVLLDPAGERAWVEVYEADGALVERVALATRLSIGRDPGRVQLVLDHETVSAVHALLERVDGTWIISDAGSRNGLRVNGEVVRRRQVYSGDEIAVGALILRIQVPDEKAEPPTVWLDQVVASAALVRLDGIEAGRRLLLDQLDTQIGRAHYNDIIIDDPSVSRAHARIHYDGSAYQIVDLGTPNGTWLGDVRLIGGAPLVHGQELRLGGVRLRFEAPSGGTEHMHG
jgi:pSer/pThr/pTyr-binding forkhead associated (FHA) protein